MSAIFSYKEPNLHLGRLYDAAPQQSHFPMHTHQKLEIFCFVKGQGVYFVEGTEYPLEPGDILIMHPAESHYIHIDSRTPYERIILSFFPEYLSGIDPSGFLLRPFQERPAGKHNLYKSSEFPGGVDALWQAMMSPAGDPHVNLLSGMLPLLNTICRLWLQRQEDPQPDTPAYRIIRYINCHLDKPLSMDTVCAHFYISKSQLSRLFKKATGTTFWQYITIKRLAKARQLLAAGSHPTHIFSQCGFNDYSAFYRAYIKAYGVAPGAEKP